MIKLDELPQVVGKTISREFLYWLIQAFNRINAKLELLSPSTAGNVVETAAGGEIADSGKTTPGGDFVGTTDTQTLTNKTLTQPVIDDFTSAGHDHQDADDGGQLDHGAAITSASRADDDHPGHPWLAGRAGGQTLIGGTASGDDLTLQTSAHATKGSYIFSEMTSAGYVKNTAAGVVTGGNVVQELVDCGEPTGFVDKTDSTLAAVIDTGNIKVTITGTNFEIYSAGVKFLKSTQTYTITSPVAGTLYYVFYNGASPTLAATHDTNFWTLSEDVPICTAYYDGTNVLMGDERHGIVMDWATHVYLHRTVGTRYSSGLGGTFDSTTLSIDEGELYDEDLLIDIPTTTTCRVLYRASGYLNADAEGTLYYKSPAGVLKYDNAGALASVTNNYYVAAWIFGVNDPDSPVYGLVGQREDQKLADARANNTYESLSFGTFPFAEMKILFRVLIKNDGGTPTYVETQDLRSVSNLPGGTYVATDHGTLTGLSDADHPETALVLSDNTTNNATTSAHGFCPKLSNVSTEYLSGIGTWTTPASSGSIPAGIICMWSGAIASIPSGWLLCNGSSGTPDLRDKFVVGATSDDAGVAKTNITGGLTQTGGVTGHLHSAHAALAHSGLAVGDHTGLTHAGVAISDHTGLTHAVSVANHAALTHPAIGDHATGSLTHGVTIADHPTMAMGHAGLSIAAHGTAGARTSASATASFVNAASHTVTQPTSHTTTISHTVTAPTAHGALTHAAISDHAAVSHTITSPLDHGVAGTVTHAVTQPSAHGAAGTITHAVTSPSDHSVSVHDTVTNLPLYYALAFIMKS